MKVAGGLLLVLGLIAAVFGFINMNNYTLKEIADELAYGGSAVAVVGVVLCLMKPKNKKKEKLEQQALKQQIQLQQQQIQKLEEQSSIRQE